MLVVLLCLAGLGVGYMIPLGVEAPPPPVMSEPEPQVVPDRPEPSPLPEPEPSRDDVPTPSVSQDVAPEPQPSVPDDDVPDDGRSDDGDDADGADDGDDGDDDAPQPKPAPEPGDAAGPYAGTLSLTSSNIAVKKEWAAMMDRLLEVKDVDVFLHDLELRMKQDVKELFSHNKLSSSKYRAAHVLQPAVEVGLLVHALGPEMVKDFLAPKKMGLEEEGRTSPETFWRWCLTEKSRPLHQFLTAYKLNSGNMANLEYSFRMLYELWARLPDNRDREQYLNLALACALVCPSVVNQPSMMRAPDGPLLGMKEKFDYYVEMDKKRKLHADVKKLSVVDLLLVVDARITRSEFDWVQKNLRTAFKRENWGATYESVEYMMERATQNKDPYTKYTLEEIKKEGGVCRDRAYYAATSAKCMGIPATIVVGDGNRGPHAWVNLLNTDKGWTGAGSYGYKTGRYVNPCSGRMQHESMLLGRDRRMAEEKLDGVATLMLFADYLSMLDCSEEARSVAHQACSTQPLLTSAWDGCLAVMKRLHENSPLPKNEWKRLQGELMRHGSKNSELIDLAQEVQTDYVLADARDSVKKSQLRSSARKLKNVVADGREDILLDSLGRQAQILVEKEDFRALVPFYRPYYKQYANNGDVFCKLLGQHIGYIDKQDDKELYKQLAKEAERAYAKGAYKGGDYFKIKKDAAVMGIIAELYRRAGDEKRAERMKAEAEKIVKESARRAEGN